MFQLSDLESKVAFITGANQGIGQSIALTLGSMGATVIGTGITQDFADDISKDLEKNHLKGYGVVLDVTDPNQVNQVIEQVTKDVGSPQVLINNAGITQDTLMLRMSQDQWEKTINTNLTGVFNVTKACLRGMVKSKWGRIISLGSVVGIMGNAGQANYAASKAGIIGFSKSLAKELGSRGITVNVLAPGYIETKMTQNLSDEQRDALLKNLPINRLGTTADIANACAFLASEQASYITGEVLNINGGMHM